MSSKREAFMELIVAGALGIVLYCGYLTARDIITDLVQEGVLSANPLVGLVQKWQCAATGFFNSAGLPQRARRALRHAPSTAQLPVASA
jgi:hypothetical protein